MLTAVVFLAMIVLAVCMIKSIYQIIRVFVLRSSLEKEIDVICLEKEYEIEYLRTFTASIFKASSTPDVIIKTRNSEYLIRFITCRQRKRMWYFVNAEYYVRVLRVYFAFPGSRRYDPFDIIKKLGVLPPFEEKYTKSPTNLKKVPVMLFNPSPVEINYINEKNEKFIAGNGSVLHGWTVYNSRGFLNALEKDE